MEVHRLIRYRPWLYHLTDPQNLAGIREDWYLKSASQTLTEAGEPGRIRTRRTSHQVVHIGGRSTYIRDQAPLHRGNISLSEGFSYEDLVELINQFVFFWPGNDDGPLAYGRRHFARYSHEAPVLLRARTEDVLESAGAVYACAYNSGAPRCTYGKGSPRGPNTFVPLQEFSSGVSRVVEIVVREQLTLPDAVQVGTSPDGPYSVFSNLD